MNVPKKRRKIDAPSNGPPMSAIAARRARIEAKTEHPGPSVDTKTPHPKPMLAEVAEVSPSGPGSSISQNLGNITHPSVRTNTLDQRRALKINDGQGDLDTELSVELWEDSPEPSPEKATIMLSTFRPSRELKNFKELKNGDLLIRLAPGERLVILGQYEMLVLKGEITFLGATISATTTVHAIYAPSSHSLPVIRCLGTEIFSASAQRAFLQPLVSPPQWNAMLANLADTSPRSKSVSMLCGPKASGKSTFTKLLANKLLLASSKSQSIGVAILDLDPGQPEFSLPGQLSLIHLREPNFGPPFSHPRASKKSNIIRSHAIAAVSPSMDPNLYTACAIDLYTHYRILVQKFPECPLIINTPGWVLGTGLEILVELISKIHPTEVIYMSEDGPREVVDSLKESAGSTPVYTLPSQASEYTTRTAVHLRTMQYMSYLHLNASVNEVLSWNNAPLTSVRPWEIHYLGDKAGLLAIICYGEQPSANLLAETINGTLVSVVVVDDMKAIPGWKTKEEDVPKAQAQAQDNGGMGDENYVAFEDHSEIGLFDVDELHPISLTEPLIIRTQAEKLPYFNPENAISLNPRYSQALGLALIRGIDVPRRKLQILTSIEPSVVEEINRMGKNIVLISGKLDTPGWAYTEELVQREVIAKQNGDEATTDDFDKDREEMVDDNADVDDSFTETPWVQRLQGSEGRGVGSRVWRVRRDLGKNADTVT
ncbi:hypothetical protein GLAREA_01947 [Glarea lozoyensis ATCC 20868]|uniref:Polynucleotide 5'-hydroxyl-kinase GRC3 n=1 Tax=Glarea lozoyensis (strain ATCC 20868 / MF5171) TaxID=1116229 RepID=S3CJQ8_GLAL2|nr:uncharacterized protein GLAREA_01947 [Glarea lozoyensis ATCC 20868]EPE26035.1 hypothetical protein GLAREA_01947 [Glarea lozoyensis ATCC 20868]